MLRLKYQGARFVTTSLILIRTSQKFSPVATLSASFVSLAKKLRLKDCSFITAWCAGKSFQILKLIKCQLMRKSAISLRRKRNFGPIRTQVLLRTSSRPKATRIYLTNSTSSCINPNSIRLRAINFSSPTRWPRSSSK